MCPAFQGMSVIPSATGRVTIEIINNTSGGYREFFRRKGTRYLGKAR